MTEQDDRTERAHARVGTFLKGKWHIDEVLGIGGMATVYAGTHKNQKRVAIKMLHPELSHDPTVRERFLREGYAANTVRHRGVVEVLDEDVTDDGLAFLVMELLEGETLEQRRMRKGGRLDVEDVLALTDQLLDVLAAAHEKGIVHRDLKPENVFYTRDRAVKVLDFGIARIRQGSEGGGGTRVGSVMGTPAFMAPEQARARWDLVDQQTDVWAVGATMYTLFTGRPVREADTANEELALAITLPVPSIGKAMPSLPEAVALLVDKALAYEKKERWADALAMQGALREVYAAMRAEPPDVASGAPAPAPRSSLPSLGSVSAAATAPGSGSGSLPGTGPANFASPTLVDTAGGKSAVTGAGGARSRVGVIAGAGLAVVALVAIAVARLGSGGAHPAAAEHEPSSVVTHPASPPPPVVTPTQQAIAAPPQASSAAAPPPSPASASASPFPSPPEAAHGSSSKATSASAPAKATPPPPPAAPATPKPPARKSDPFSRRD